MDRSGIFERLEQQLQDDRDPARVQHSLISQIRTLIIQHAQGWDDLSDTQLLSEDPVFQLACSDQHSTTSLTQQRPSQPTLSRLLNLLAQDANLAVLHNGLLDLGMWRLSSMRVGKPLSSITLDVDGLPMETFGSQAGTAYNNYVGCTHYSSLAASIAETGDMVGGLLRKGNSGKPLWQINEFPSRLSAFGKQPALRCGSVLTLVLPVIPPCLRWLQQTYPLLAALPAMLCWKGWRGSI